MLAAFVTTIFESTGGMGFLEHFRSFLFFFSFLPTISDAHHHGSMSKDCVLFELLVPLVRFMARDSQMASFSQRDAYNCSNTL